MTPILSPHARLRLNRETVRRLATHPGTAPFVAGSVDVCVHSEVRTECLPPTQ